MITSPARSSTSTAAATLFSVCSRHRACSQMEALNCASTPRYGFCPFHLRIAGWYFGEPMLEGIDHQSQAIRDSELVKDGGEVVTDRFFGNKQPFTDLFVPHTLRNQDNDFTLAHGELRDL